MIKVTGSPKIQERFSFGFTDDKHAKELEIKLNELSAFNFKILDIDVVFGYVTTTLPNPAINSEEYKIQRGIFVEKIEYILNNLGDG